MAKKPVTDDGAMKALKAQIRTQTVQNLYLFHGEEVYLRDFYLGQLQKALLPPGLETFNLHRLSGKETDVVAIARAVDCLPMMGDRTLIIVTDYDMMKASDSEKEGLLALFKELPDYVCLVFVYDLLDYKPDGRTSLSGALKDHVVPFTRQTQGDLTDWVHRRFAALGCDIDTETARFLLFFCGDLMTSLASEIGKIGAYAGKRRITKGDIEA
ncbi:MAG: DNA polymerase III subunit delta, partial [Oscillospiraceae bacterium]